ncbi:hypothetical protein [Bdellovibrio svalbardensis]|uniref:Lipoprotein n=1 Tax=Bdellovibrio svalbardensis TaxID=2972972 RepID=A0ABT6DIW8_9BACT|nr:hypothetical protein [Bdellovibrio svalbardensis]MDG0816170.1 hypothetical protein [Bdellovibrio svalbardensis]
MQTSKTLITLLLSLNVLSLAACNLPTPKDKEATAQAADATADNSEAATFNVEAAPSRSSVLESTKEGSFALPTSKVFNLYACLKDIYYNKVISGHKFKIDEAGKEVTTDASGCLVWSETIQYNYLADSQYIKIDRHIRGTGLHKGVRTVSYAINPWSHGENLAPVMDVKNEDAIPNLVKSQKVSSLALKGFSADQKLRTRPLWLEEGRLFVTEQKLTSTGVDLLVEMRGTPAIQLTKMNGEIVLRPLTSGSFKARIKLIHSYLANGKELHRLLAQTAVLDAKMENGSLAVRAPISLAAIPTRGQMVLGVQLLPENGPEGLTGFDGIYILGDYDQIKGSSFLKLASQVAQEQNFKIDNYVNAQMPNVSNPASGSGSGSGAPAETLQQDAYQKPKIEVSQLEIKNVRVGAETTSTREVIYNIKACVKNGLDQKSARAQTFKVTKFRQNEGDTAVSASVKTDNNACITWDESIKIKYFDCQRYIKGYVQIENADLGMNEKLAIIVNPWDNNGSMGRDLRYVDANEKLALDCKAESRPKTQVIMDSFSYNTLSYNYQVDNLLNLNVIKKIQFKMDPRILMYSSLSYGRGEVEKLRDGVYLLKLAVVRNRDYDSKNTYVSSAEKFVNVMSGQINTDITFQTQDLKALGNRNNMLVELYPVDETKVEVTAAGINLKQAGAALDSAIDTSTGLETPTFVGPVVLNVDEASRPLRIVDASSISTFLLSGSGNNDSATKGLITQVVKEGLDAKASALKAATARSANPQFAQENNLALINVNAMPAASPLTKALNIKLANTHYILNKEDLQGIITNGRLTKEAAQKLCAFWANDFFPSQHPDKGGAVMDLLKMGFGGDCFHAVSKDPSRFFQVEKRLAIKEVGGTKYVKGFNQGLSVGTNFSYVKSHSTSVTKSVSVSAKAGISKKFLDLFSLGLDVGGSISWSATDSTSNSNAINIGMSTSMTVQQSLLKVRVNQYEQCVIVNLNPLLFIKDPSWFGRTDYLKILNPRLNESEQADVITRGLMICEGQVRTQPIDINENFYLIAQESYSAQMQDSGDERNRNFFVALRSTNDFNRFVLAIKGETKAPATADKETDLQKETTNMMEKLFQMGAPSFPGMYLVK